MQNPQHACLSYIAACMTKKCFFFQFKISLVKCWCAIAPPLP